jgi:hypothetical protein
MERCYGAVRAVPLHYRILDAWTRSKTETDTALRGRPCLDTPMFVNDTAKAAIRCQPVLVTTQVPLLEPKSMHVLMLSPDCAADTLIHGRVSRVSNLVP